MDDSHDGLKNNKPIVNSDFVIVLNCKELARLALFPAYKVLNLQRLHGAYTVKCVKIALRITPIQVRKKKLSLNLKVNLQK